MRRARFAGSALASIALCGLVGTQARAAEAAAPASDPWRISLSLYLWLPGIDGTLAGGRNPEGSVDADIDIEFPDVVENLDSLFGLMGHVEARHGPLTLFGDGIYLSVTADRDTRFDGDADIDITAVVFELGAAYEVYRTQLGDHAGRHAAVEVLAGARYQGVDIGIERTSAGGVERGADGDKEWIDPFVGLRGRLDVTDRLYAFARGDVGGYGISSDLVWNANVGLGFEISDPFDIAAGYRWLDYDYEKGDFTFDVQIAGPWVALTYKF